MPVDIGPLVLDLLNSHVVQQFPKGNIIGLVITQAHPQAIPDIPLRAQPS